jgi:hypothetical protein
MPAVGDFRNYSFDRTNIDSSGKDVGRKVYWKLYAIENLVRVLVHSVLTAQAGTNWWAVAVDPGIRDTIRKRMADYAKRPWHSTPGKHDIYFTFLSDLNRIIVANSHLFEPVIPDIDQWIARIEQVRLPRNVVGHMNWPSVTDRQRIDVFYSDIQQLMNQLADSGVILTIP